MKNRFTQFIKRATTLLVAAATLVALPVKAADNTPRFNQMEGDLELLTGRNVTANQTTYSDPVSAVDNDTVRVKVWYHNNANQEDGQPGAAATNTTVTVALPDYGVTDGTTAHILSAVVKADNAAAVAGTIVNGTEVGQAGLRINTDKIARVTYVPGTVKWYPNGSTTATALPNGQNGDSIITSGINLGDINGCWQFSGNVTFDVKITPAGNPSIVRAKTAVNETQGNVPANTVKAKAGDVIAYTLTTKNAGNRDQEGLVVSDDLKDVLEYSTIVDNGNGTVSGNSISYAAINLAAGQTVTNTFKVKVNPADKWPTTGNLTMTNVYGNAVDVPVLPPVKPLDVTIKKEARLVSLTSGFSKDVTATGGDVIEYRLLIKNTGENLLNNLRIADVHDGKLQFLPGTVNLTRNGKTAAVSDEVMSASGYKLDTPLKIGEEIVVTYRMQVVANTASGLRLCNDASVSADQVDRRMDTVCVATTVAAKAATATPVLPQTGPGDIMFALLGAVSGGASLSRYRQAKKAVSRAANDISVL